MTRAGLALVVALTLGATACGTTRPARLSPGRATSTTSVPGSMFGDPVVLAQVDDPALPETSGLAASRRNPGLLWIHNDSGDEPRLYCLTREGTDCGTWQVTGARALDWEDMAVGPGPDPGRTYLYMGDIGDNEQARESIVVYRVPEPAAPAPAGGGPVATEPAEALTFRYEDGPHNAEALLVHPVSGDLYVVVKDPQAASVYKAAPGEALLRRIGEVGVGFQELVTAGDIAPDGRHVALATYARAYELTLPEGTADFDAVWQQPARRVEIGARAQGETIAYRLDGAALLATSERLPFPLLEAARR